MNLHKVQYIFFLHSLVQTKLLITWYIFPFSFFSQDLEIIMTFNIYLNDHNWCFTHTDEFNVYKTIKPQMMLLRMIRNSIYCKVTFRLLYDWKVPVELPQREKLLQLDRDQMLEGQNAFTAPHYIREKVFTWSIPHFLPGLGPTIARVDARKWRAENFSLPLPPAGGPYPLFSSAVQLSFQLPSSVTSSFSQEFP